MLLFLVPWQTFAAVLIFITAIHSRSLMNEDANPRQRRMVNSRNAIFNEWRFIAYLNFHQPKPKWKVCGGALIQRNWVLTAAHCIEDIYNQPEYVSVTVGKSKRSPENHANTYKVKRIVIYKDYLRINSANATKQDYFNWDYDIALLQLKDCVSNEYTEVVDIPLESLRISEASSVRCRAAGWGSQKGFDDLNQVINKQYDAAEYLQEIDVPVTTKAHCRLYHGKEVSETVFCGGQMKPGTMTTCYGDSGSPLVCSGGTIKKPTLAGIVIGGNDFCKTGKEFMVFTEVARYRDWIDSYLNC